MKLSDKFKYEEIEWRVQQGGLKNGKPWALILPYITSRAIMDRLDDVMTPPNWRDEYKQFDHGIVCTIYLRINDEWIGKSDGAPETNIDAFKGGLSDALKRAAVKWGMGRYLYSLKGPYFADIVEGKAEYKSKIKDKATGKDVWISWNPPKDKEIYSDM